MAGQRHYFEVEDSLGRRARVLVSSSDRADEIRIMLSEHNLTCGISIPVPKDFCRDKSEIEVALSYLDLVLGPRLD